MNLRVVLSALAVVFVLAGAGGFFVWNSSQATLSCGDLAPTPTIAVLGDSLVAGYGAPAGSDFVTKLSTRIGVPIMNWGVSGDTTAQGLARAQALTDRPDVVLILLGGNDALQKVPLEDTKANLSKIIELYQSYQSKPVQVVLVGVLGGLPIDPYASMFKQLAEAHHVTYVPNVLSGIFANSTYMYDQVHPNAAGYEHIAERLEPILNSVCRKLPRAK